jgi:light-regulated signal transduction histidine kinase (bacteriophytochrome)
LQELDFVASHDLREPLQGSRVRRWLRAHAADALDEESVDYIERTRSVA